MWKHFFAYVAPVAANEFSRITVQSARGRAGTFLNKLVSRAPRAGYQSFLNLEKTDRARPAPVEVPRLYLFTSSASASKAWTQGPVPLKGPGFCIQPRLAARFLH